LSLAAGWTGFWIGCSVNVARPVCPRRIGQSIWRSVASATHRDAQYLRHPLWWQEVGRVILLVFHGVFRSFGLFSQATSWDMPVRLSWPLIDTLEYARGVSMIIPVRGETVVLSKPSTCGHVIDPRHDV